MSKSVGNVIDPFALVETYGLDRFRYFLLREVSFGQDGNYSHDAIVNRTNSELANDLGNLAQRSLSMIAKHCDGAVPEFGDFTENDQAILDAAASLLPKARMAADKQELHQILAALIAVVSEANRYFAGEEPCMQTVLYVTAEILRQVAILMQPFIPESAGKMLDILGIGETERSFTALSKDFALKPGRALPAPQPIFPRFVESESNA